MRWSVGRASARSGAPDHVTGSDDCPLPFVRVVSQARHVSALACWVPLHTMPERAQRHPASLGTSPIVEAATS